MFDPQSALAVRMISLQKAPPQTSFFENRLAQAWQLRSHVLSAATNCFRLINGEGDLLPGIICDVYADVAVLQFDGPGPYNFWDPDFMARWLLKNTPCRTVYFKPRHDSRERALEWGHPLGEGKIQVYENNCQFYVDVVHGQKTGFFLDQRDNRNYLKTIAKGQSVINLFSYSGGFSVYAGIGGAQHVTSVDIAQEALDLAEKNWQLNGLNPTQHLNTRANVFEYLKDHRKQYDIAICDPPSLAKAEKHKATAVQKYIETFADSARIVKAGGHLLLSSCSSHIGFNDFQEIITAALSKTRQRAQVLRVSGQGPDHPYPHACEQLRYLKFADLVLRD
jgi:23S rRNA (cytosine1962-C5)-methyltransferase